MIPDGLFDTIFESWTSGESWVPLALRLPCCEPCMQKNYTHEGLSVNFAVIINSYPYM